MKCHSPLGGDDEDFLLVDVTQPMRPTVDGDDSFQRQIRRIEDEHPIVVFIRHEDSSTVRQSAGIIAVLHRQVARVVDPILAGAAVVAERRQCRLAIARQNANAVLGVLDAVRDEEFGAFQLNRMQEGFEVRRQLDRFLKASVGTVDLCYIYNSERRSHAELVSHKVG